MNGHQNEAFSCLIGALNSPRKVNGYGADYAMYYKHEDVESILRFVTGREKESKMYNLKTKCL